MKPIGHLMAVSKLQYSIKYLKEKQYRNAAMDWTVTFSGLNFCQLLRLEIATRLELKADDAFV